MASEEDVGQERTPDGARDAPGLPLAVRRWLEEMLGPGAAEEALVSFRLYVAGSAPNSIQAMSNLRAICEQYLRGHHHLEVVDILEDPKRALADGVLVTPTLVKLAPGPVRKIVGNLSNRAKVLSALGLKEDIT